MKIETKTEAGQLVAGAECKLTNDYGVFQAKSGETVQVRQLALVGRHAVGGEALDVLDGVHAFLHRQRARVFGQFRAVHQHTDFGIPQHRSRVEVERTDEGLAPVEHDRLAVQARIRTAMEAQPPGTRVTRLAA